MAKQLNLNYRTSASLILLAKDKLKPKGTADYKVSLYRIEAYMDFSAFTL